MNELRDALRRGDPLMHERELTERDIATMRRWAIEAARAPRPAPAVVSAGFATGAAVMLCITVGAVIHLAGGHDTGSSPAAGPTSNNPIDRPIEHRRDLRRVYFETPSGVHVIWQFETE